MDKIQKGKKLMTMVLLVSLFALVIVNPIPMEAEAVTSQPFPVTPIEVKEVSPEVLEAFKRLSEENVPEEELVIQPMAIECPNCNGHIITRYAGAGAWVLVDTEICRQHANCAILEYERTLYYEEICGGSCGYKRSFTTPDYKYKHSIG